MLSVLCWLPMFSIAKRTLPYLDAFALGTARYAIGVLLLVLLLVAVEGRAALRYEGRASKAALSGLAGITGFNLFVWLGLAYTRPEHASIIMALQTPMTALAVWALRGQRPAAFTLGCVAAAICGVLLVVTKGDPARAVAEVAAGGALFGDLLVLFGAISWVAYTVSSAGFAGWSPLRFTVLTCIPGFAGLAAAQVIAVAGGTSLSRALRRLGSGLADRVLLRMYRSGGDPGLQRRRAAARPSAGDIHRDRAPRRRDGDRRLSPE